MSNGDNERNWWSDFFDDVYGDVGLTSRSVEQEEAVERAVDWLCSVLKIGPGDTLFDQCCGVGRISLPMARRGIHAVGADITEGYVEQARKAAAREKLPCTFHRGDCFEFVAPNPCDAGISWFTSFGYHQDDRENRRMLQCAFDSLRPRARFALDHMALPRVLRQFQSCQAARCALEDGSELLWLVEPTLDFVTGTIPATWTWIHPSGEQTVRRTEVRMYLPHDLIRLFESVGFDQIELYGSHTGGPFNLQSHRCVVVGTHP